MSIGNFKATYTSNEVYSNFETDNVRLITVRETIFNGRVINAR